MESLFAGSHYQSAVFHTKADFLLGHMHAEGAVTHGIHSDAPSCWELPLPIVAVLHETGIPKLGHQ